MWVQAFGVANSAARRGYRQERLMVWFLLSVGRNFLGNGQKRSLPNRTKHMRTRWLCWWVLAFAWVLNACGGDEKTSRFQNAGGAGGGINPASGAGGATSGSLTQSSTTGIMTTTGSGTGGSGNMEDPTTCA